MTIGPTLVVIFQAIFMTFLQVKDDSKTTDFLYRCSILLMVNAKEQIQCEDF